MKNTVIKYVEGIERDFGSLKPLDCFRDGNFVYIKTSLADNCEYNAIVVNGAAKWDVGRKFNIGDRITPLNADISFNSI